MTTEEAISKSLEDDTAVTLKYAEHRAAELLAECASWGVAEYTCDGMPVYEYVGPDVDCDGEPCDPWVIHVVGAPTAPE